VQKSAPGPSLEPRTPGFGRYALIVEVRQIGVEAQRYCAHSGLGQAERTVQAASSPIEGAAAFAAPLETDRMASRAGTSRASDEQADTRPSMPDYDLGDPCFTQWCVWRIPDGGSHGIGRI